MALPIDVSSIDVLRGVREAFLLFADDARNSLGSMESEVRRAIDWLTHDQRLYWQGEVKRRTELLSSAKAELSRKHLGLAPGEQPHDSEQREAVRDAKKRLEEAEEKVENVNRWLPVVERAVMEYESQARPFSDMVEFDVERSVEMLDRMIVALEEYLRLAPPETAAPQPTLVSSSASPVSVASETVSVAKPAEPPVAEEESIEHGEHQ